MTRRPWRLWICYLGTALPFFLLAAASGWGAESRPLAVPERLPLHLEVTVLRLDPATKALVPVPAEAPLENGDAVAFDVEASRGGYLALLSAGTTRQLWPPQATGHPLPAQATVRVPASGLIRLSPPSPTKLSLVFSPRPLDGSAPPGSTSEKPKWLKQIILREATLEPDGQALVFEGHLGEAEKAVVELELRHP
jgi:hypothetical protein